MTFANKNVLVTGASRGIGRAAAMDFAAHGARVAVHYRRDRAAAEKTLSLLHGGPHALVQADLASADSVRALAETVIRDLGGIDVLVNNAGIYESHPLADLTYPRWREVWSRTLDTNLLGPAHLTFLVAHHMIEKGGGRIVNVSSRGAFRGEPSAPAYGASKAGLNAMSQSLAQALAPHKIYVYVVAPGYVETDMTATLLSGPKGDSIRRQSPLGRAARPEEIARTILFLSSEGSEYLTGCIVDANGASYLRS